jgi:hypothetical protein
MVCPWPDPSHRTTIKGGNFHIAQQSKVEAWLIRSADLNEKKLVGFCAKLPANPYLIELMYKGRKKWFLKPIDGSADIEEEVA